MPKKKGSSEDNVYILDTSALLSYIEDEDGAGEVEELLVGVDKGELTVYISFISITEIFYITLQERGESEAMRRIGLIQSLGVKIVDSYERLNLTAAQLKAFNRISLADSFIAALSMEYKGILVHKDPEFEKMSTPIREHRLPYK